ncbi:cell division protein FtsL [Parvibium lacunae]|uniref:Cell division protein FtsL n=1 Tax=Parvibium lacunae TaxID=1888893 RepID=A0A368L228_9BURK|nr:cell division protein FtsL [Parvibium lacunae]RCS57562.1 cell division protein FtsL [Parvibium lacunae]
MTRGQIFLILLLLASAFGLINARQRERTLFVTLDRAQATMRQLEVEWDQLQLEQSNSAKASLIDSAARRELRMQSVTPARTLYVSPETREGHHE